MLPVKVYISILYNRATQMADRGPYPDLSSVETGPQAPGCVTVSAVTDCEKAHAPFTKLC